MYKSFCHIIISLLLLITTTGMAVSKHFCDDFLISASLFSETESCCNGDDCCHHEKDFYQLKEDFQPSQCSEIPASAELELMSAALPPLIDNLYYLSYQPYFAEIKPPSPPKIQVALSLKQAYLL